MTHLHEDKRVLESVRVSLLSTMPGTEQELRERLSVSLALSFSSHLCVRFCEDARETPVV